ncbi:recombinase family protein [Aurantimonas coralicida]|uniref:recombinase family protein n=1 Tax=Aurantimonas coralicida TaxID=182270 RepID=UPI00040FC3C0|nr:recombinase family protein [Aurantimonas coralicida]
MTVVAYARVSTGQQDYQTQVDRLKEAGAEKVFHEKRSGLDSERPELARCLEFVREGDTLLVTKLDRLARSTADLYRTVTELQAKGVAFKVLDDSAVDTTTRTGKLVMGILALIAEFETEIRKERQMEGIARAKAEGRIGGRPPKLTGEIRASIMGLREEGNSIRQIAAKVGFSKATVQKVIAERQFRMRASGNSVEAGGQNGEEYT